MTATNHWDRPQLVDQVLEALRNAGKDLDHLTVDDLAATDQFHGGGIAATLQLAEAAGLDQPAAIRLEVLDVGGGLGGPARTLATRFGCHVTVVDLSPSYVEAARKLTELTGLGDFVTHQVADALDLPFADQQFDVVWTQNSGMNIADKPRLYRGFHRVLRPGGTLAFQEPLSGLHSPPHFPMMWADDPSTSFLVSEAELRSIVAAAGFTERAWRLVTETSTSATAGTPPPHSAQMIIMGEDHLAKIHAASRLNLAEQRIAVVQAVFARA